MKPLASLTDEAFGVQVGRAVRELRDAPEALQRQALAAFAQRVPSAAERFHIAAAAIRERIAAVLSSDSWSTAGLAHGMRSMRSDTRHLLYNAGGRDIDLRISPAAEAYSLAGQILGPDESGVIELSTQSDAVQSAHVTDLDALGEFRIHGLRPGSYRMVLRLGSTEVELPTVDVGERVG